MKNKEKNHFFVLFIVIKQIKFNFYMSIKNNFHKDAEKSVVLLLFFLANFNLFHIYFGW